MGGAAKQAQDMGIDMSKADFSSTVPVTYTKTTNSHTTTNDFHQDPTVNTKSSSLTGGSMTSHRVYADPAPTIITGNMPVVGNVFLIL